MMTDNGVYVVEEKRIFITSYKHACMQHLRPVDAMTGVNAASYKSQERQMARWAT
jgi:hypothetical protein